MRWVRHTQPKVDGGAVVWAALSRRKEISQDPESRELGLHPDLHPPAPKAVLRVKKRRPLPQSPGRGRCPAVVAEAVV